MFTLYNNNILLSDCRLKAKGSIYAPGPGCSCLGAFIKGNRYCFDMKTWLSILDDFFKRNCEFCEFDWSRISFNETYLYILYLFIEMSFK